MEPPHLNRPVSRDRGVSESFAMRPRAGSEVDPAVSRPSTRGADENRSPAALPRAFESMLKTTTETGDIGIFSIKPSRVPQSTGTPRRMGVGYNENLLQRSRQTFRPFGVPIVDDRRRLPSYTMDATSEVISMYETASQKSASRVFDDPDYRSYSMTQTSYSAYTLSNNRSYASLRSQQDGNGLLQRPRSPFAYPARLKRPGFRPSSPALTDGGVVDYSRRAEIDRTTYGGHNTSSPSTLYAQKRKPPLSLRQEANRSTPSLLSQPSSPRRSPSPGLRQSDGNIAHDWGRRNGSTSGNTSPARSTFSFASTANLYATVAGTSNTTTPGKLAPSSPLYYDYTEDFEVDGYDRAAELSGSPPHFSIDKTIPEERPSSAECCPSTESRGHGLSNSLRYSYSPTPTAPKSLEGSKSRRAALSSEGHLEPIQPSPNNRLSSVQEFENCTDKKIVRLSGLGYGAQELSTHVEEAFGLLPTNSFEVSVSQIGSEEATSGNMNVGALEGQRGRNLETQFTGCLSDRLDALPPRLSSLPSAKIGLGVNSVTTLKEKQTTINGLSQARTSPTSTQLPRTSTLLINLSRPEGMDLLQVSDSILASPSSQSRLCSSGGFKCIDTGFTELTDLIKSLEESNRAKNLEKAQRVLTSLKETTHLAQSIPDESMLRNTNMSHGQTHLISSFSRSNSKEHHVSTQGQPNKRTHPYGGGRKVEISTLGSYEGFEDPNFSHQMAMRVIPRSGSPMLAPKPISPARQLKLKNSVPQLMKALPALPSSPQVQAISPVNTFNPPEDAMPCHFSPLLPKFGTTLVQETRYEPEKVVSSSGPPVPPKGDVLKVPVTRVSESSSELTSTDHPPAAYSPTIPEPPPRLKLKIKSFATLRPPSPPRPKPWEREKGPPWPTSDTNPRGPGTMNSEKPANPKPPKFRLKVTRASGSTYGTVRVNRESGDSKVATGFHLRNHKDLFTSNSGIDSIFRQVSQHLHSRKASASSNTGPEFLNPSVSIPSTNSHLTPKTPFPTTDFDVPRPSPSHEARSVFSDDSSHIQGHRSMRGRLSNLRARIGVPYVNRIGSQSYDDLTWRDRSRRESTTPLAQRSASNLHSSRKDTGAKPHRSFAERMQHHRLKETVRGWLKEARSAIRHRMKSRSTTGSDQVEVHP